MPPLDVRAAVADACRSQWGFVVAATMRVAGDIDLAEECVQEALERALATWPSSGPPDNPGAWLTTVARRRAIDVLRRRSRQQHVLDVMVEPDGSEPAHETLHTHFTDDRLRLIYTCCHPALSVEAQVALTLRLLCGLTTSEVARAFLVSESTMAARITRAKKKISTSRIPYRVPTTPELPARTDAVLTVVHLLFTTGHTAPTGADLVRRDLVDRSLDLARMLHQLLPDDAEVAGLLALILLTDARRSTRTDSDGSLLLLSQQDRRQWDHVALSEGITIVHDALQQEPPGRFALMAALSAVHARAPSWELTDWSDIVALYDRLLTVWPSPVVALNRAVAVGLAEGPEAGLDALDELVDTTQLKNYNYLASARADFLRRLGRNLEAREAYVEALGHSSNEVERAFLSQRLADLEYEPDSGGGPH